MRLRTSGDIYHRNLLSYTAGLGVGLRQQRFTSDGRTDTEDNSLDEYDVAAQILQTKPYPISLYTTRSDQTQGRRFSGSIRTVMDRRGGLMGFRVIEDWPMRFQYSRDETDQSSHGSTAPDSFNRVDERFRYSVSHDFGNSSILRFNFEREDISNRRLQSSTVLKVDKYDLFHDWLFGSEDQHRLDSDVSFFDYSGISSQKRLRWQELMRLKHRPDFWTNYTFRFAETKEDGTDNRDTLGRIGFRHELYESLVTTGNVFASESDISEQVDLTERGGGLALDYRKRNPWGMLYGLYAMSFTRLEQSGSGGVGRVNDESHVYDIDGSNRIELNKRNVDASTIVVADSTGIPYDPFIDYRIEENSGVTSIVVITGGRIFNDAVANGGTVVLLISYDFFIEPEQENDICTQSFSVRQRFENGLALYYRHRRRDEDMSSNIARITPDEFRANTLGAEYANKGLYIRAEYSKEDSTQIPSTSKWLQGNYNWAVDYDTRANIYLNQLWNDFEGTNPHDVKVFTAGGTLSRRLADMYDLVGGIDYRNERDSSFGDTEGFQFDLGLRGGYRQLTFNTGVKFDMLSHERDDRDSTLFYFRLKRMF
ncbi:MAG: hypothetical protein ACYTBJ_07085 [Planctomycetota bacterium]